MGEYSLVSVKPSEKSNFKLVATFKNKKTGKEKKTHFGKAGMSDYTKHKDKERRSRYRGRHMKDLKTKDPIRAGYLSYYILWGPSTSLRENISSYKKRFFPGSSSPTQKKKSSTTQKKKSSTTQKKKSSPTQKSPTGLNRWFKEEWVDEHGNPCGSKKNKETKKCRPKKRISKKTPVTWGEMSPSQKKKAIQEKKKVGMGKKAKVIKKGTKVSSPGTKLCSRGKETAKKKFKIYPSAYANGYAVQVCKGTKADNNGVKKCSPPYC